MTYHAPPSATWAGSGYIVMIYCISLWVDSVLGCVQPYGEPMSSTRGTTAHTIAPLHYNTTGTAPPYKKITVAQ